MEIDDRYREEAGCAERGVPATLVRPSGVRERATRRIPVERVVEMSVNTVPTMRIVCTPTDIADLVVGRLLTEGYVSSDSEIESVYICSEGVRAEVFLDKSADFSRKGVETVPSCCTGNRVYNDYFTYDDGIRPLPAPNFDISDVFAAAGRFAQDTPVHSSTTGTHSCLLLHGGDEICREDIGRHNAFDKAVGAAVREGWDTADCLVYSSGHIPVDMVMKAMRAGIPLLATKAAPTDETVRLAEEFGLTLVCQARPDEVAIYSNPHGL